MRLWPLIVWFIGDAALMRLTSRYTTRIRSFVLSNVHRSSVRRTNSNLPRIRKEEKIHSLARPIFFNRASIYTRCVISLRFWFLFAYIYIYIHTYFQFLLFRVQVTYDTRTRRGKRRGEESEIGEANDRFLQIFYPWKCIKVLVFIHSANVYFVHIYTMAGVFARKRLYGRRIL